MRCLPLLLVSLGLLASASSSSSAISVAVADTPGGVLVRFGPGAAESRLIASVGGRRVGTIGRLDIAVLEVPDAGAALARLRQAAGVTWAERNGQVHAALATNDPYMNSTSWQLARPAFPSAWDLSTGSPETVIAVLDTGVGPHPDLGTLSPGYDFIDNDADPTDHDGHGTGVAGIINAVPNNGVGVSGACWSCQVMPVRVLSQGRTGNWNLVAAGIVWAVDHGADVINMSFSSLGASLSVGDAIAYALAHDVVVVASAGNDGRAASGFPAAYPGVLSVGAVDEVDARYVSGSAQGVRWGSNYGSSVGIAAAGCAGTIWKGGSVARFCGTSTAAPFVAALAGLLRSYNPAASGEAVATAIRASAVAHPDFANGRIDAAAAIRALAPGLAPRAPQLPPPLTEPATRGVAPKLALGFRSSVTRAARGQLVTFTIRLVSDVDTGWALGTIALPRQLEFISFRGRRCSGRQLVSCQIGNLSAAKPYRVTVVARVRGSGDMTVRATARTVDGITTATSRSVVVHSR